MLNILTEPDEIILTSIKTVSLSIYKYNINKGIYLKFNLNFSIFLWIWILK